MRSPNATGLKRPHQRVLAKGAGSTVIQFLLSRDVADHIGLMPRGHFLVELERTWMILRASPINVGSTATSHRSQIAINVCAAFLARGVPEVEIELPHKFRGSALVIDLSALPTAKSGQKRTRSNELFEAAQQPLQMAWRQTASR
jgi:hypothetical protein